MYSPKYSISNEILKNIGKIEAAREVIDNAPLVPAWEKRFRNEAVIRTVHHGTHLEGNELSMDDVEKVVDSDETNAEEVEKGKKITGKLRDVQEVINYREAMGYIDKLDCAGKDGSIVLTEEMLKEIHRLTVFRILPAEESGKYRKVKVVIRNTRTGEITFRPPPPIEIPYLMDGFFGWLNDSEGRSVHPIIRAGIVHYELARVHAFTDGNGRAARAMALLTLFVDGYEVKKFFSLEEYYDAHPQNYYDAFKSVDENKDLTSWLEYFTLGITVELNRVKELVQKLSLDLKLKGTLGGKQIALSERQIRLIEYLERHGQLTMSEGREILSMVSDDTVLRDLRDLVKKGLVVKKGKTKGVKYYLKQGK